MKLDTHLDKIHSRSQLAKVLGIKLSKLTYLLYKKKPENFYEEFNIPKKNGEKRNIAAPKGYLRCIQRKLANFLYACHQGYITEKCINSNISHGFEKGTILCGNSFHLKKGIISNARLHTGKKYILNVDILNFFDAFHFGRVQGYFRKSNECDFSDEVATVLAQLACYKGKLPQGAPTSPIIANLIFNIVDVRIAKLCKTFRLMYSRYADDLTFSTNSLDFESKKDDFLSQLNKLLDENGFSINKSKINFSTCHSRQLVTGLVVNLKPNVSRSYIKKTRAMADSLYRKGIFFIEEKVGKLQQLEGRFSFINQLDTYNNHMNTIQNYSYAKKSKACFNLNSREKEYQKFLFYKHFYLPVKPLIITEGKTDERY